MKLQKIDDYRWMIPQEGKMRVPGMIYADASLLEEIRLDQALQQVKNVAELPGIVKYSLAMPDIHWGYGFPIGGVAATDAEEGVISPGGVGYDINCGVRLLASNLFRKDIQEKMKAVVDALMAGVPTGVGSKGRIRLSHQDEEKVFVQGARWAIEHGYGTETDLERTEDGGCLKGSNPDAVSDIAKKRGKEQLGSLGSGNHFCEVGFVEEVYDEKIAQVLGLEKDLITVIIHCGSRGFGHQVCDDYLKVMARVVAREGIELPDRQLACAPLSTKEAKDYIGAMRCAANYAWANRQMITHWVRETLQKVLDLSPRDLGLRMIYDVCHNIAKFETHMVNGKERKLCVHRKGATRAFPAGHEVLPDVYRDVGQPVLIPGDMGRYSFVLVGTDRAMEETFGSTCHGAGRRMSRAKAKRASRGRDIVKELRDQGVEVRGQGWRTLVEEIPEAYKDVAKVVNVVAGAGISKIVAKLKPIGVIKG
ncbi:RtcB family protein [candidate division TA06 bacterium]|nr:RtcB family protein [candidate division TA06 bacterium]